MGLVSPVVGRIYDRIGPTLLLVIGAVLVSLDLWAMTLLGENTAVYWVLAAHVTLSIGLALLFTPLFTASLGSVEPSLYSHGSAIVATLQQVAGAAGTALFVTIMSAKVVTLTAQGASTASATNAGIHAAFVVGAVISLFAIPAAFFVRKNAAVIAHGEPGAMSQPDDSVTRQSVQTP
jgi:DHA2 family lincomycin resistance protein-like MFS transporter